MATFSNNTPATAEPIILPFTASGDFGGDASAVHWFSYTTTAGAVPLGEWMLGLHLTTTGGGGDFPTVEVRLASDPNTPINPPGLLADPLDPIQHPVTPGVAYLFKLYPDNPSATITISIDPAPLQAFPAGSFFIPDDNENIARGIVFDPVTGTPLRIAPLLSCEFGDVSPNGFICVEAEQPDDSVAFVRIYNAQLQQVASITNPVAPYQCAISSDGGSNFYFMRGYISPAVVKTIYSIDTAGVLSGTTHTINGGAVAFTSHIAVAYGGTVCFYTKLSGLTKIGRYDLAGSADLTDFATTLASHTFRDILALRDGTVIAAQVSTVGDGHVWFLRHYAADGSTLADYTNADVGRKFDHIARDPSDETRIGLWVQNISSPNTSIFQRLRISDMTVVSSSPVLTDFNAGYGTQATAQGFGPSDSCPLLILAAEVVTLGWLPTYPDLLFRKYPMHMPSAFLFTPLQLICPPATTGTVGIPYSSAFTATGGQAPYTFAIVAGVLPPGLSLNPATGLVSGTPTESGIFDFTGQVTDALGSTALASCEDNIGSGIIIFPPDTPTDGCAADLSPAVVAGDAGCAVVL